MLPEPPAARRRRAVRHARGAAPGPDRPRHRPRARHRPGHRRARCARTPRRCRADDFPQQLARADRLLRRRGPDHAARSRPCPARATCPRSGCSARATSAPGWPGELGLPFSFAHHFSAAEHRCRRSSCTGREFRRRAGCREPYAMVAVGVVCAETDERGRVARRAGRARRSCACARAARPAAHAGGGGRLPVQADGPGVHGELDGIAQSSARRRRSRGLLELLERTGPDELMLTTNLFDHSDRLRSYELIAAL